MTVRLFSEGSTLFAIANWLLNTVLTSSMLKILSVPVLVQVMVMGEEVRTVSVGSATVSARAEVTKERAATRRANIVKS